MKNIVILGSGRSGTSMVAGSLSHAGYFMGDNLMPPTRGNPKGYFESFDIEAINEDLLSSVLPARPRGIIGRFFKSRPIRSQRWLARVPVGIEFHCSKEVAGRIRHLVIKEPYCFKDPRFSYTLPAWRSWLKNTVFICVFRDPASTIFSILKECKNEKYLHSLSMSGKRALQTWILMYKHILDVHRYKGEWLFIHFNQVLEGNGLEKIAISTGAKVDSAFPDTRLNRSSVKDEIHGKSRDIYMELCNLAGYKSG